MTMSNATTSNARSRTITLTDRPPVTIHEAEWPVVAAARRHDGEIEYDAIRRWGLRVRQHEDGRALVYATYSTSVRGAHNYRGGELLESISDVPAGIRRVGERAAEHASDGVSTRRVWLALIDECIADLPSEEL